MPWGPSWLRRCTAARSSHWLEQQAVPLVGSAFPGRAPPGKVLLVQATSLHHTLADELWQADTTAVPISPLTDRHPDLTIEDAYAIQTINTDRRVANGERICGRKIGLTSKPMQQLLGVDEPDYGVLLDGMFVEDGDVIDLPSMVQPRVEAEMAFVMETDLEGPGVNTATALRAIAGVLPAVEIVDSRVADWKIKLVDTVADNASSGLIVMGRPAAPHRRIGPAADGRGGLRRGGDRSTWCGRRADPARCAAWLARELAASARPARRLAASWSGRQDGSGPTGPRSRGVRAPGRGHGALLEGTARARGMIIRPTLPKATHRRRAGSARP